MSIDLFPLYDYWWLYLAFTGFALLLLALDLRVFHRKAQIVSFREAATWSIVRVVLSLLIPHRASRVQGQPPRRNLIPGITVLSAGKAVGLFSHGA